MSLTHNRSYLNMAKMSSTEEQTWRISVVYTRPALTIIRVDFPRKRCVKLSNRKQSNHEDAPHFAMMQISSMRR